MFYVVCALKTRNKPFNTYLLLIILQQNTDIIKVENDMDIVTEEDSIGIKFDEVYIPSAFCVEKAEPEVSLFCGCFVVGLGAGIA